jgi:hypothetical protein
MPSPRTLLILGRTSNLPTVWSNCLAGWWLGGHQHAGRLPALLLGGTLLYAGGMYLNDAFDVEFDSQFRRERPIPSGVITRTAVWQIGLALLGAGMVCLFLLGKVTADLAVLLALAILAYDAVHKLITVSPLLMAACRFLLYLVAASTGAEGVTGEAVWCGFALAAYVVGLSCLARKETSRGGLHYWPCYLLATPVALAMILNTGGLLTSALLVSAVFALWVARCLRYAFASAERNIGHSVAGLLAGIVWVDWLAVVTAPRPFALLFIGLFATALYFQRTVPAT